MLRGTKRATDEDGTYRSPFGDISTFEVVSVCLSSSASPEQPSRRRGPTRGSSRAAPERAEGSAARTGNETCPLREKPHRNVQQETKKKKRGIADALGL